LAEQNGVQSGKTIFPFMTAPGEYVYNKTIETGKTIQSQEIYYNITKTDIIYSNFELNIVETTDTSYFVNDTFKKRYGYDNYTFNTILTKTELHLERKDNFLYELFENRTVTSIYNNSVKIDMTNYTSHEMTVKVSQKSYHNKTILLAGNSLSEILTVTITTPLVFHIIIQAPEGIQNTEYDYILTLTFSLEHNYLTTPFENGTIKIAESYSCASTICYNAGPYQAIYFIDQKDAYLPKEIQVTYNNSLITYKLLSATWPNYSYDMQISQNNVSNSPSFEFISFFAIVVIILKRKHFKSK